MNEPGSVAPSLAATLLAVLERRFDFHGGARVVIGIAGESGSGKSVTAAALARALDAAAIRTAVLNQDDYFLRPPRANHEHRRGDLSSVGPHEVDLARLADHVAAFRAGVPEIIVPRVDVAADRLTEHHRLLDVSVLVVEGTYVLTLPDLDLRVFMAATHTDTHTRRAARNRDLHEPFVDDVLAIEHQIIVRQRDLADLIVNRDFVLREA